MRTLLLALALLACVPACTPPKVIQLEQRFRPLERIRESNLPGIPAQGVSTIFTEVLTRDMGALLYAYPQGSVDLEALLRHEQVHAIHELADPTLLARYALNPGTRWQEEKSGWGVELKYLRDHGKEIDVEAVVAVLAGPYYRQMVTPEDARAWVREQLR